MCVLGQTPESHPKNSSVNCPMFIGYARVSTPLEAAFAVTAQFDVEGWSHDAARVGDGAFGGLAELEVIPAVPPLIVPSK